MTTFKAGERGNGGVLTGPEVGEGRARVPLLHGVNSVGTRSAGRGKVASVGVGVTRCDNMDDIIGLVCSSVYGSGSRAKSLLLGWTVPFGLFQRGSWGEVEITNRIDSAVHGRGGTAT